MASTINARTASGGGVQTTADATGILKLQSEGVDMATFDPVTGLALPGRITMGARVAAAYQWNTFSPSDVAGTLTNAGSTGTTVDSDYVTLVNSSGTVTCTFDIAGTYMVHVVGQTSHSSVYSVDRATFTLGGTATRLIAQSPTNSGDSANDLNMSIATSFLVTATAGQTLTVLPKYELTGGGSTSNHSMSPVMSVVYSGG